MLGVFPHYGRCHPLSLRDIALVEGGVCSDPSRYACVLYLMYHLIARVTRGVVCWVLIVVSTYTQHSPPDSCLGNRTSVTYHTLLYKVGDPFKISTPGQKSKSSSPKALSTTGLPWCPVPVEPLSFPFVFRVFPCLLCVFPRTRTVPRPSPSRHQFLKKFKVPRLENFLRSPVGKPKETWWFQLSAALFFPLSRVSVFFVFPASVPAPPCYV